MFQSDLSYMISPQMFREFVVPDLEACCQRIAYSFYHMDGVGQLPHLEHLLNIPLLKGIQWIPGEGKPQAEHWLDVLRQIREAGKLVQVDVSADGARRICRAIGGHNLLLAVWDPLTVPEARQLLEELADA
jgi:hypothetical protein